MRVALVHDNEVVNVVEAESLEKASELFPQYTVLPAEEAVHLPFSPPKDPRYRMSRLEFRRRFTLDELVRMDHPDLFVTMTPQQKAVADSLLRNMELAEYVDLRDPLVVDGLSLMVQLGLLSEQRRQEILDPRR